MRKFNVDRFRSVFGLFSNSILLLQLLYLIELTKKHSHQIYFVTDLNLYAIYKATNACALHAIAACSSAALLMYSSLTRVAFIIESVCVCIYAVCGVL